MLHDPNQASMFPRLPADKIREMCAEGDEVTLENGQRIYSEGEANYPFCVVLDVRLRITKHIGKEDVLLVVHEKGQFTGEISMLMGAPAAVTATADGPARVVLFATAQFRRMLAECPDLAVPVLKAFVARTREVGVTMIQQEKMATLGKIAASLAHELNNPVAAMVRTVKALRSAVSRVSMLGMQYDCRIDPSQRAVLDHMQQYVREHAADPEALSPLDRSDLEEAMTEWLDQNGIQNGWEMAPGLVNAGMTRQCLTGLSGKLTPEALSTALTWLEADLTTNQLATELESAASRISDLVLAMKQYSYMDQAQFQEVDLHIGLDSTLKIFAHRTKGGIEVRRDYDRSIPKIPAFAGELNQVWTNLISNALDAMTDGEKQGKGVLTVRTRRDGDDVVVTIGDTGAGIPPEIRDRLFEPFVTSKPAGQGTGLGLETARRIVVNRHQGRISVESKPGDTQFEVRLPLQ
ncbi:MAG: ATP-binding protein, partial [Acidobacteriota bacterium]